MASTKPPCEVCRLIRGYLLMFVPMIIMLVVLRLSGDTSAPAVRGLCQGAGLGHWPHLGWADFLEGVP